MNRSRSASTPFVILGLLALEPMSGWDIRNAVNRWLSHFWSESFGQIYPALARLTRAGLVRPLAPAKAARGRGGRRVYALTPRGRAALGRWRERAPVPQPPRNELLLRLFLSDARHAPTLARHLARVERDERAKLAAYAGIRARLRREAAGHPSQEAWLATLRYGELHSRTTLAWCREVEKSLARPTRRARPPKPSPTETP